jgi:hypothetical protein
LFVFGIAHEKAQRKGWAFPIGVCRAVYVVPEKRVARLGAAICGAGCETILTCLVFFFTSLLPQ